MTAVKHLFNLVFLVFLFLCRHFLFKTGTGSTAFFGTATPGYTMATGAVYSTPARPLPRSSLSRGAFKFKKSPRHCSWRCTALGAVGVATLLSLILCYCIGTPLRSTASVLTDTLYQQHLHRAAPTYSRFPLDRWNAGAGAVLCLWRTWVM